MTERERERERLIELLNKKYDHFCDQCGVNKADREAEKGRWEE